jgi:hypothetical protein
MKSQGPPRFFVYLLSAGLLMSLVPFANVWQEFLRWFDERASLTEAEQLRTYRTQWTNSSLTNFVDRICEFVPEDAKILLTPVGGDGLLGNVRWHVFLNEAIYPRQIFVRRPQLASGTAMNFIPWVEYHQTLDLVEPKGPYLPVTPVDPNPGRVNQEEELVQQFLRDQKIEWEIRYFLDSREPFSGALLLKYGNVFRVGLVADDV